MFKPGDHVEVDLSSIDEGFLGALVEGVVTKKHTNSCYSVRIGADTYGRLRSWRLRHHIRGPAPSNTPWKKGDRVQVLEVRGGVRAWWAATFLRRAGDATAVVQWDHDYEIHDRVSARPIDTLRSLVEDPEDSPPRPISVDLDHLIDDPEPIEANDDDQEWNDDDSYHPEENDPEGPEENEGNEGSDQVGEAVDLPIRLSNSAPEFASARRKRVGQTAAQQLVLLAVYTPAHARNTTFMLSALLPTKVLNQQSRLSPDAFFNLVYTTIRDNPHIRQEQFFGSLSPLLRISRGLQSFNGWTAYVDEPAHPSIHGEQLTTIYNDDNRHFRNCFTTLQQYRLFMLLPKDRRRLNRSARSRDGSPVQSLPSPTEPTEPLPRATRAARRPILIDDDDDDDSSPAPSRRRARGNDPEPPAAQQQQNKKQKQKKSLQGLVAATSRTQQSLKNDESLFDGLKAAMDRFTTGNLELILASQREVATQAVREMTLEALKSILNN